MTVAANRHLSVLSLEPNTRGLGYILFEDEHTPATWGIYESRVDKNQCCLARARLLILQYRPRTVVLELGSASSSRRRPRVRQLLRSISQMARREGVKVRLYSRDQVRGRFAGFGCGSKDDMAVAVAAMLPELSVRLPSRRRPWESERHSMPIFEAAAIALTHYAEERRKD